MPNSSNKLDDVRWLRTHFSPTLDFTVGRFWFGIIPQGDGMLAIKQVDLTRCERAPDEGTWMHDRCETESGCCYLILSALDEGEGD